MEGFLTRTELYGETLDFSLGRDKKKGLAKRKTQKQSRNTSVSRDFLA
jgi:hypothetical protein